MRRLGGLFAGILISAAVWLGAAAPALAGPFSDWAVVVVAGDFHDHAGAPSEIFDNARRDVTTALISRGFSAGNIQQFTAKPQSDPSVPGILPSNQESLRTGLNAVAARARGGCLIYFSSHGAPTGLLLGAQALPPLLLSQMVNDACGARPTIMVISACFSGVFLQALSAPNRMVLTAARPDRTSFGCGSADKYPFFDECFLQSLPQVHDFAGLGPAIQACVSAREIREGLSPPSEPQFGVDPTFRPMLPLYRFSP